LRRFLQESARIARRLLHLIPHRPCTGFRTALDGTVKVGVGHLQIMFGRNRRRVAQPSRCDVQGIILGQFGFARAPAVLEGLLPRL